jgi:hypothetical protein
MSTFTAANNGQSCKNCQVAGDGEACQTYEITDLRGDRGSAVGYKIVGNNFSQATDKMNFAGNSCSQEAKEALHTDLGVNLGDKFQDFIYKKPYVTLNEGDKFEVCALFAATVSIHDGCCDNQPPGVNLNMGGGQVTKQ